MHKDTKFILWQIVVPPLLFIVLIKIGLFDQKDYKCHDIVYHTRHFSFFEKDSFGLDGKLHFDGGLLLLPFPQNDKLKIYYTTTTWHPRDILNIDFKIDNRNLTIVLDCFSSSSYINSRSAKDRIKEERCANENLAIQNGIQYALMINQNPYMDSKLNENYDIYPSKDSTYIKKIFYWEDSINLNTASIVMYLYDQKQDIIKYGTKEYMFFDSCMLDNILLTFSESRRDSILLSHGY